MGSGKPCSKKKTTWRAKSKNSLRARRRSSVRMERRKAAKMTRVQRSQLPRRQRRIDLGFWSFLLPAVNPEGGGWLANLLEQPLFSEQFVEVSAQALMPLACRKVWYDSLGNCAAIAAAVMRYV